MSDAVRADHTPTPWRTAGDHFVFSIDDHVVCYLAASAAIDGRDDREFIVRACNAYDDLLAACEAIVMLVDGPGGEDLLAIGEHARAAIAKATRGLDNPA